MIGRPGVQDKFRLKNIADPEIGNRILKEVEYEKHIAISYDGAVKEASYFAKDIAFEGPGKAWVKQVYRPW
jgi:hypothetical protein